VNLPLAVRRPLVWLLHAALAALSWYGAFVLRLDDLALVQGDPTSAPALWTSYAPQFRGTIALAVALKLAALQLFGLNRGLWRYASLDDLLRLGAAVAASSLALFVVTTATGGWKHVPHGVHAIDAALSLVLLGGVRFARRVAGERARPGGAGARTVVVGAGDAGEAVVREMRRHGREVPVAFVDDDPEKRDTTIHGVPVRGGVDRLAAVLEETEAVEVVVAVPSLPAPLLRRVAEAAAAADARVRVLRRDGGPVRLAALRQLDVADLLTRPVAALDEERIRADIAGRRVLVTGGAGSIGSELVRRVLSYGPASLVVVDRDENALHYLLDGLDGLDGAAGTGRRAVAVRVADVADPVEVERVVAEARPEYVLHAAAYKHVPLMETNPLAAVRNNVGATRALLAAADRHGAQKFLLVSSDKAVRPSSVMGATKRAAELALAAAPLGAAVRVAVRFGNVVGSAGSVVPLFVRQIERGGPVTVTHRDATRFFMTIPEAASLVLQAASMARGLEVFHLDMGEPVRIHDLATRMIHLAGFVPGRDVEIREIGLRPGEKLHEELLGLEETVAATAHPQVRVATAPPPDAETVRRRLDALEAAAAAGDRAATFAALSALVPEYAPTNDEVRRLLGP
jgi:FlaA1/EpsC-like NDP-sugar epimerase